METLQEFRGDLPHAPLLQPIDNLIILGSSGITVNKYTVSA